LLGISQQIPLFNILYISEYCGSIDHIVFTKTKKVFLSMFCNTSANFIIGYL